jgi:tRNA threonylcarbamoyl adenosine modification protein YeaZ
MLLSIDSSLGTSVAVVSPEGKILHEANSEDPRAHAELIGQLLTECFSETGVTPGDITHVVMGVGPGPFTGLRVGMAAATAFSLSRGVPLLPVVSHDALGFVTAGDSVVVTDAKRGEVAYSVYGVSPEFTRLVGPALCTPDQLDLELGEAVSLPRNTAGFVSAGALALVAHTMMASGVAFAPPSPIYLRAPDVGVTP